MLKIHEFNNFSYHFLYIFVNTFEDHMYYMYISLEYSHLGAQKTPLRSIR